MENNNSLLKDIFNELEFYEQAGVSLFLNESKASPYQISKAFTENDNYYMRDYIKDNSDKINEIHFNSIDISNIDNIYDNDDEDDIDNFEYEF